MYKLSGSFPLGKGKYFKNLSPPLYSIGQRSPLHFFCKPFSWCGGHKSQDLPSAGVRKARGAIQSKFKGLRIKGQQCKSHVEIREPRNQNLDVQGPVGSQVMQREETTLLPPPSALLLATQWARVMPTHGRRIIFSKTSSQTHSKVIFSQLFGHLNQLTHKSQPSHHQST